MNDMNKTILIGRLTRDMNFSYLQSGSAKGEISIAVNNSKKVNDQWVDEANYFDITIWGKTAENLKPYLLKGQQVAVEGHLKQDRWEKDGQKFSKVCVVSDNIQLIGGNRSTGNQTNTGYSNQAPVSQQYKTGSDGMPEEIPF